MTNPARQLRLPEERVKAADLASLIDQEIERLSRDWQLPRLPQKLEFRLELEEEYEIAVRDRRIRQLRSTLALAIGIVAVLSCVDPFYIPDMGWKGAALRMTGCVVLAATHGSLDRVSDVRRESMLSVACYAAIVFIVAAPAISHAPLAPFALFVCPLTSMFTNIVFPFRFRYAAPFTLLCLVSMVALLWLNPRVSGGIASGLILQGLIGGTFTLVANYRMEHSVRLGHLMASKEALRLWTLHRDRDQLLLVSDTDALTGVANRRSFDRRAARLFAPVGAKRLAVSLVMIDVDFFKRYNDHYGHPAGDACLQRVATALVGAMRNSEDLVFRYGGEEFGALLADTSEGQALQVAERIRAAVEQQSIEHANRQDGTAVVTVSVGVGHTPAGDGSSIKALVERTDALLYAAKGAGRNCVRMQKSLSPV